MNAAYGFLRHAGPPRNRSESHFVCCATDEDWRPEWRVRLIDTYKASRRAGRGRIAFTRSEGQFESLSLERRPSYERYGGDLLLRIERDRDPPGLHLLWWFS